MYDQWAGYVTAATAAVWLLAMVIAVARRAD